jgi:hypothetical protein
MGRIVILVVIIISSVIIASATTTATTTTCTNITSSWRKIDHFEIKGVVGRIILKWTLAFRLKWNLMEIIF